MKKRENKKDVAEKFIQVLNKLHSELITNNYTREEIAEAIIEMRDKIAVKYKVD